MRKPMRGEAVEAPGAESGVAGDGRGGVWTRRFWMVLLGVGLVRVMYAVVFPLDLAPDESYYWDWGRRLDIGYFSKPPMIGWLMGLAGRVGGNSELVIKLFPVLLGGAGLVFVERLGRDMFGGSAGFWAAMILLATPGNAALSTFFTIDAPLFLFWSASLWLGWRAWTAGEGGRGGWLTALTVVLGLGYLTKQIQLVFPLMLLVFLALQPRGGKGRGWGGWLAAVSVSLLFLTPPLVWNWRHDWITFRHTADEIESVAFQWGRSLRFVGEFLGGQAGLGGGVSWGLMMLAGGLGLARWRVMSGRERYLLLFFVPGWAAYAGLAMHQRVEQNWPLVFYPAAAVLVAGWAWGSDAGRRWRRWVGVGVGVGGVLAGMLMAVPFVAPAMPWAGERKDPTARVRGWRELAERVEVLRAGLARPERTFLLAPGDRYVASALAFYLADRPRTYCWEEPGRPVSQYGIWGRPDGEKRGWDALIIERDGDSPRVRELKDRFETWESKGVLEVRLGPGLAAVRRYRVFLGGGFLGGGDGIGGGG